MNWGQKLRKITENEKEIRITALKAGENFKKAKEELSEYMESDLGEILENKAKQSIYFSCSNNDSCKILKKIFSELKAMVSKYKMYTLEHAFEEIGLQFTEIIKEFRRNGGGFTMRAYVISWE